MINNKEMNDLIKMLARSDIPFEVRGLTMPTVDDKGASLKYTSSIQICSPSIDDSKVDAICHQYSYGGDEGLIEVMSIYEDDVAGWLTADQAFEFFEKVVRK